MDCSAAAAKACTGLGLARERGLFRYVVIVIARCGWTALDREKRECSIQNTTLLVVRDLDFFVLDRDRISREG